MGKGKEDGGAGSQDAAAKPYQRGTEKQIELAEKKARKDWSEGIKKKCYDQSQCVRFVREEAEQHPSFYFEIY